MSRSHMWIKNFNGQNFGAVVNVHRLDVVVWQAAILRAIVCAVRGMIFVHETLHAHCPTRRAGSRDVEAIPAGFVSQEMLE